MARLDLPLDVLDQRALPASQALLRPTPLPLVVASLSVDGPVVHWLSAPGVRRQLAVGDATPRLLRD